MTSPKKWDRQLRATEATLESKNNGGRERDSSQFCQHDLGVTIGDLRKRTEELASGEVTLRRGGGSSGVEEGNMRRGSFLGVEGDVMGTRGDFESGGGGIERRKNFSTAV